uniref:uncharacterized protein LOC122610111 n=1 Tax=Erigeron canadensis TaxID=72917 RepID=UPI001CB90F0B|nr:uncharacterized protein LOC122610111 [Erigeron canadensis]
MAYNVSTNEYLKLLHELGGYHVPKNILDSLSGYTKSIYRSEIENSFSAPMLLIGLYIAFASLVCILAMAADLVHGLHSRKLWFPCKYFKINSFYLTVIAVAMKLPVDLTGSMPGVVDQMAKVGSMAFMCTVMANLLPCLATMDDNDLYSNMAALSVFVITMVVNVFIQIKTGVVSASTYNKDPRITALVSSKHDVVALPKIYTMLPTIYVALLLVLLILYASSFFALLTSKEKIKSHYPNFNNQCSRMYLDSSGRCSTFQKLKEYVETHWFMAGSSSSQFIFTGCFQMTCASGVICVVVTILHILTVSWTFEAMLAKDYDSDYSWSMIVIVILQLIGVMIGTVAPLCRCFAPVLSFNVTSIFDNIVTLLGWMGKSYFWRYHLLEAVMQSFKWLILRFCIVLHVLVLVVCSIIALSLNYFPFCVKRLLKTVFTSSNNLDRDIQIDISTLVEDYLSEWHVNRRMYDRLKKLVKQFFQKGKRNQPYIELLKKSTPGFHEVGRLERTKRYSNLSKYDTYWSLQVVTLATIACSLPEIGKNEVDCLLRSVRECLPYVMLVDESFSNTSHHIQKMVKVLWKGVDVSKKWLENKLLDYPSQLIPAQQVVEWFKDTARNTSWETSNITATVRDEDERELCIVVMRYLSEGILNPNAWDGDNVFASQQKLFDSLSSIIADTIAACLTNLQQVIIKKCNPSVAEEREDSVKGAALLLGETEQLIKILQQSDLPNINRSDMPFFNKWVAYYKSSDVP